MLWIVHTGDNLSPFARDILVHSIAVSSFCMLQFLRLSLHFVSCSTIGLLGDNYIFVRCVLWLNDTLYSKSV